MYRSDKKLSDKKSIRYYCIEENLALKDNYFDNLEIRFQKIKKLEKIEYIEDLILSLSEMAKKSGENLIAYLLNIALQEAKDRKRMISAHLEPEES